ncbi:MAG: hypothetical protein NC089_13120 [Bacteroides sp.]|nr:hypothetical protein [Bacteroides sp.]MCM1549254.1 hypothetical protein [Clostridium sp.]
MAAGDEVVTENMDKYLVWWFMNGYGWTVRLWQRRAGKQLKSGWRFAILGKSIINGFLRHRRESDGPIGEVNIEKQDYQNRIL